MPLPSLVHRGNQFNIQAYNYNTIQTYQQTREQTRTPSNLKQAPQMVSSYHFNVMTKQRDSNNPSPHTKHDITREGYTAPLLSFIR